MTAKTIIGYCDGRNLHYFEGAIDGNIPDKPSGKRDFQWDCAFIPKGTTETFSDMGDQKNKISMRRKALDSFYKFLSDEEK